MEIFRKLTLLSLEQATVLPYLTFRLAQDGMRIIRLEHPVSGDPNRWVGENVLGEERMNAYYLCINAGKESLTLNLGDPEGRKIFHDLIDRLRVDIFATNQLPKNYAKLGIDYDTLKSIRKEIIWLGVTGFGPESNEAAYDPILQARSGLMEMTGEPDGPPQVTGIPLPDMGTSEHAYGQLMKALFIREKTGLGSCIHLSMFESSVSWLTVPITMTDSFGKKATRRGNTHEFFAPVSVYRTRDGYIYLAVGNDRQWKSMVAQEIFKFLDRPEYEKNAGRIKDGVRLNHAIEVVTTQQTTEALIALFRSILVPVGKIQSLEEVCADPMVTERLLYTQDPVTGRRITLAPPPYLTDFVRSRNRELSFPPRFGEDNRKILSETLGYSEPAIAELKSKGIL